MTRVLKSFEYFEPKTLDEVVGILSQYGAKAKVLAGGCDLVPSIGRCETQPEYVVSLGNIPGLDYVEGDENRLRIGALTKIRSVELALAVEKDYAALYEAVRSIVKIQVKNTGTFVGNLCVASPASDIAPPLLVLEATLRIEGDSSERIIPIESFYIGVKQSRLKSNEIVTEVSVPKPPANAGSSFLKLARTSADIAKVNVAARIQVDNNTCKEVMIALGSVAPTPVRAKAAEEQLKGQRLGRQAIEKAAKVAAEEATPITDVRSTAEYRKEAARVLVRRAIEKAVERAKVS